MRSRAGIVCSPMVLLRGILLPSDGTFAGVVLFDGLFAGGGILFAAYLLCFYLLCGSNDIGSVQTGK